MTMGRPPKSNELKKLQNTARVDRFKSGVEFEKITKPPKPPVWLSRVGKIYFKKFSKLLMSRELLFNADVHNLCFLAENMATYEMACRELQTTGDYVQTVGENNYQQQSPWVNIRDKAQKNIVDVGALFGLDPLSRQKFNVTDKPKDNPFDKL